MRYPLLWTRLYNAPLFVHPAKAAIIEQAFQALEAGEHTIIRLDAGDQAQGLPESAIRALTEPHRATAAIGSIRLRRDVDKPYALTESGIAIIPVLGTLIQRGDFFSAMSGMMSYGRIERLLVSAVEDDDVDGILLEVDSFGGEANGMIDLADKIFAAREMKPVWASINEQAYSAAYGLASAAERLYAPKSGGLGSIGTIMLHMDQSEYDAKKGLRYTYIYAGARKADFNPHEPLSDRARAEAQAEVDRLNDLFIESVAVKRGISADKVRATQAGVLAPADAVAGGFATGIATFSETVRLLEAELLTRNAGTHPAGRFFNQAQEDQMSDKQHDKPAGNADAEKKFTQADLDNARAEGKAEGAAGVEQAKTEAHAAGRVVERVRIAAIQECDEAKDRPNAARLIALKTDVTPEQAKPMLAGMPKEGKGGFAAALSQMNPQVGADKPSQDDDDADTVARRIAGVK